MCIIIFVWELPCQPLWRLCLSPVWYRLIFLMSQFSSPTWRNWSFGPSAVAS
jgi:hypothetical protein